MSEGLNSISIIGCGNVASHLAKAFAENGVNVSTVFCRNKEQSLQMAALLNADTVESISALPKGQFVLICVPDDQIQKVVSQIPDDCPMAYTSGSIRLDQISTTNDLGVFYPLQTFTKGVEINMFEVPILIESRSEHFTSQLFDLAWKISRKVEYANSETRGKIHLAAVWVNNFVNHCIFQSDKYCSENEIDFSLLMPLLKETIRKVQRQSPFDAQTGPARRGDHSVIEKHLNMQSGVAREIYQIVSNSILDTYKNNEKL